MINLVHPKQSSSVSSIWVFSFLLTERAQLNVLWGFLCRSTSSDLFDVISEVTFEFPTPFEFSHVWAFFFTFLCFLGKIMRENYAESCFCMMWFYYAINVLEGLRFCQTLSRFSCWLFVLRIIFRTIRTPSMLITSLSSATGITNKFPKALLSEVFFLLLLLT